jgi:hypothetical protein
MASETVEVFMTLRQWEKRVIHIGGIPGNTVYRMALNAIF